VTAESRFVSTVNGMMGHLLTCQEIKFFLAGFSVEAGKGVGMN
jgi:hypothetical protein